MHIKIYTAVMAVLLFLTTTGCSQGKLKTKADPFVTVTPKLSAEESVSAINNNTVYNSAKIKTEKSIIYTPTDDWQYAHHPHITFFKGKFYAIFSSAAVNEEDCGQRIMLSVSEDGSEWSEPEVLAEPQMGDGSLQVLMPDGFYAYGDTLKVYYSIFEWPKETLRGDNLRPLAEDGRLVSKGYGVLATNNGKKWKAENIKCAAGGNFGPIPISSGRLIMPGASTHAYTDDLTGLDWKFGVVDTAEALSTGGAEIITEGSFYQTEDGVIHMLHRSNTKYLYGAESYDGGATWSKAYKTGFTDDMSKFRFGQLPDGRYYYVGNCEYTGGTRSSLILCISEDGVNFDKWYTLRDEHYSNRYNGLYKGGIYGYPSTYVDEEYFYVIYSKGKETIEVTKFKISELDSAKFTEKIPEDEIFKTNLSYWEPANGKWTYEENLGYLITPEKKSIYISMSNTKTAAGQSFTYEADVTVLSDYSECFFSLVFGATNTTQNTNSFDKETYYELRIGINDSFSRFFTIREGKMERRGGIAYMSEEELSAESFHIKMDMDGKTNMATYYINGNFVNKVYLEEFSGGYFGLLSYNGGIVFNNVMLTAE